MKGRALAVKPVSTGQVWLWIGGIALALWFAFGWVKDAVSDEPRGGTVGMCADVDCYEDTRLDEIIRTEQAIEKRLLQEEVECLREGGKWRNNHCR